MAESIIEKYGDKVAAKLGYLVRKVHWIGHVGAPDKIYAREDTGPILVEYKDLGKKPRASQEREIQRLRSHGINVVVLDSMEAVDEFFKVGK